MGLMVCAQRHPPALARVWSHAGYDNRTPRLPRWATPPYDQHLRAHFPVAGGFIFWLGGLAEKSTFVPSTVEAPHVGH